MHLSDINSSYYLLKIRVINIKCRLSGNRVIFFFFFHLVVSLYSFSLHYSVNSFIFFLLFEEVIACSLWLRHKKGTNLSLFFHILAILIYLVWNAIYYWKKHEVTLRPPPPPPSFSYENKIAYNNNDDYIYNCEKFRHFGWVPSYLSFLFPNTFIRIFLEKPLLSDLPFPEINIVFTESA